MTTPTFGIWTRLTWLRWFDFRLDPIFDIAAAKKPTRFKSGQKWNNNNNLASLTRHILKGQFHQQIGTNRNGPSLWHMAEMVLFCFINI